MVIETSCILAGKYNLCPRTCAPHPWKRMYVSTEVVSSLRGDSADRRYCAREFEAVWYKNQGKYILVPCARPFEEEEEEGGGGGGGGGGGEIGVLALSHMLCILPPLRVLSCIETLVGHVMCLKGLIGAFVKA